MEETLRLLAGFGDFAAIYCFDKCIRTMFAGTAMLMPVCLIRKCNKKHRASVNVGAMTLLIPMAFTGVNKLFFFSYVFMFFSSLYRYIHKPIYGYLYFGVILALLAVYVIKSRRLKMKLKMLPLLKNEIGEELIENLTFSDRTSLARRYLKRVKIYITPEKISPYSGGILHPFIVVPEEISENWDDEQRKVILSHEFLHIKSGHIVLLFLFAMLRIYWWVNPVIYLCEKILREDLEMVCDESCIRCTGVSRLEYGRMILGVITMLKGVQEECTASFLNGNYFQVLRKRIGYLNEQKAVKGRENGSRKAAACFACLLGALMAVIIATSYPRYTRMKEITFYNEDLEMVVWDSREFGNSVKIVDGEVRIDKEELQKILDENHIEGEYVYISFDTILKVPGFGGGGNIAMVAIDDFDDVFYLAAEDWRNDVMIFMMKYLL